MKIAAVLLVWLLVGMGAIAAFVVFPFAWLLADEVSYAKNILRALDKASAAFLGWTGEYTVSAECGAATEGWAVRLGVLVDGLLGAGHCHAAALHEGLLK